MPDELSFDDCDLVARAAKKFMVASRAAMDAILRPHGLGSQQWWVLDQLARKGKLRQRELPAAMRVERATASEIVLVLVRKGLVVQHPDPTDQRQKVLGLTPAGLRLQRAIPDPMRQLYDIAFDGCSSRQLGAAARLLSAATERLETNSRNGEVS